MKKMSRKSLSFLLVISLVISCFAAVSGVASADATYTYEEETTVSIPMDTDYWGQIYNADPTNFTLTTVENSLTNQNYLNIKSTSTTTSNSFVLWAPYENKDTKTFFDPEKIKKIEVTAIYNSLYPRIPFGIDSATKTGAYLIVGNGQNTPTSNKRINITTGADSNASSQAFANTNPAYDYKTYYDKGSTVKAVFEPYTYQANTTTANAVSGSVYNVIEGVDNLMYTMTQKGDILPYAGIGLFATSANIEIHEFKITYLKTVDVTEKVSAVTERYPTLMALESAADITTANAATLINEIKDFKAAYAGFDTNLQKILTDAGVYNEQKMDTYCTTAQNLQAGVIAQRFDTDISTGKVIDDLWSVKEGTNISVSGGYFSMNNARQLKLTNGLSTAPKSLVIKAQFPDYAADNMSAGLYFKYAQNLADNGADNNYFWLQIPEYKSGDSVIAQSISSDEIRGKNMVINSTDSASWLNKPINYPTENPIVIGKYIDNEYVANTITVTIDYVLSADKTKYTLTFTISDGTNNVTQPSSLFLPVTANDFSLTVSGSPYDNSGAYKTLSYYGAIDSIEYLMPESPLTAPTVDGVKFADISNGNCDIAFQITSNAASVPDGYKAIAYGAHLITSQKLVNPLDIISKDYVGKGDLPVITAQKTLGEGETVPETYLVSVANSSNLTTGSGVSYKGVRFAAIGFVVYETPNGGQVTVYSRNDDTERAISCGQGNRSIVGVAKKIAAHEIANMDGKDGSADADTVSDITSIINQSTPTTEDQQNQLIQFVCDYQNFIQQ